MKIVCVFVVQCVYLVTCYDVGQLCCCHVLPVVPVASLDERISVMLLYFTVLPFQVRIYISGFSLSAIISVYRSMTYPPLMLRMTYERYSSIGLHGLKRRLSTGGEKTVSLIVVLQYWITLNSGTVIPATPNHAHIMWLLSDRSFCMQIDAIACTMFEMSCAFYCGNEQPTDMKMQ